MWCQHLAREVLGLGLGQGQSLVLCQHLGREVLGLGRAVLGLGRVVLSQARAVARSGLGRLPVQGRAPRVLVVLWVSTLQDVEDLGRWADRTG